MQSSQTIIIDYGSCQVKMGLSGQESPCACFPNVVGRPFLKNQLSGISKKQHYQGQEAMQKASVLNLKSPINRGNVCNWQDFNHILYHGFYNQIRMQPSQFRCLMAQSLQTTREHRQKITQVMFENFQSPKFYLEKTPRLAMYSFGESTGFIVDCGHSGTQFCSFIDDKYISYGSQVNQWGGIDLDRYLLKLLKQVGAKLHIQQSDELKNIKTNHCYVALDYKAELEKPKESIYELPDKSKVSLNDQRFRCPEILFRPNIIGKKVAGVHESIFNCISNCEKLYQNICLVGGSTLFPGFSERLKKQLNALLSDKVTVNIKTQKQPKYTNLKGGQILTALSSFEPKFITKKQYEQSGVAIIHKKCSL